MTMRSLLAVLFLLPLSQRAAPAGDPERGKILWLETEHVECRECHGVSGEGGFGPDLAGRNLTPAQFIYAVRKPWGIMPAFAESEISDPELIDLMAFFDSLPSGDQPGPWRRPVPAGAPRGLAVATTAGCVQCHHPQFNTGRGVMGAIDANFVWFKGIIYAHSAVYPATRGRLGSLAHGARRSSDVRSYAVTGWNCREQPARHHTLDEADGKYRSERFTDHCPRTARSTVSITGPASGSRTPERPARFPALSSTRVRTSGTSLRAPGIVITPLLDEGGSGASLSG